MEQVRIDKWLWAARFYKTRSLAAKAVGGGHIAVNGSRVKPARTVRPGDMVHIRQGPFAWEIQVLAVSEQRGSATAARMLYEETEASQVRRELARAERKVLQLHIQAPERKPDKHERRKIRQFLKKE
ncbi:MAG: RNA-binding S4 domain-containing protein [Desulfobulbus oligotrophicus]|jgi:ribosome-associated heat shock protein Hsp15|nr:RNA-binding S4 domain-containing protein [Desulfobulbus oligotrophicus]